MRPSPEPGPRLGLGPVPPPRRAAIPSARRNGSTGPSSWTARPSDGRNNRGPHRGAGEPDLIERPVSVAVEPGAECACRGPALDHERSEARLVANGAAALGDDLPAKRADQLARAMCVRLQPLRILDR